MVSQSHDNNNDDDDDDDSWCTFKATMVKIGLPDMDQSYSKP